MKWCIAHGERWTVGYAFTNDKKQRECFDTREAAMTSLEMWRRTYPAATFRIVRLVTLREKLLQALKRDLAYYKLKAEGESGWAQGFYMGRAHEARMLRKEFGE